MALNVEIGTGSAASNSYATLAQADSWYAALGDAAWSALTPAERERHLILGTLYVDNAQVYPYSGAMMVPTQALQWPRTGATYLGGTPVPAAAVPSQIVRAAIVAAGLSAKGLLPTASGAAGGREIKREKVDVLEVEYFHSSEGKADKAKGGSDALDTFGHPDVTGLVYPLLNFASSGGAVTSAVAARRGVGYLPADTPPAFARGQHDALPLLEDTMIHRRTR